MPSNAQAIELAAMYAGRKIGVADKAKPRYGTGATQAAVIRRGWASDTGEGGVYPSGTSYRLFAINVARAVALAAFIRKHGLPS